MFSLAADSGMLAKSSQPHDRYLIVPDSVLSSTFDRKRTRKRPPFNVGGNDNLSILDPWKGLMLVGYGVVVVVGNVMPGKAVTALSAPSVWSFDHINNLSFEPQFWCVRFALQELNASHS